MKDDGLTEEQVDEVHESVEETTSKMSQADMLIQLAADSGARFFHTPTKEPFIVVPVSGHWENWPVRNKATKLWLSRLYYKVTGKGPNSEAMQTAIRVLESIAVFDGAEEDAHIRCAWHNDALYYDLAEPLWRCVRIDRTGWEIISDPPVKFRRYANTLPQSLPAHGGSIATIWDFINVAEDTADRRLVEAWLTAGFIPDIPRPLLVFHGDQGSAKSNACKLLLALVDPSPNPCVRTKDAGELAQALAHRFAGIFDNVSTLSDWLSDFMCSAITGDGYQKRQLYTDDDDVIYAYKRLLLFNGINIAISRADLLDRSLLIGIERIADSDRKDEDQLWAEFYQKRPAIMGALFTRLSGAIRERGNLKTRRLPRMADFAKWAMAAQAGEGKNPTQFLTDYQINIGRQNEEAVSESVVATVLLAWLEGIVADQWMGEPHKLHAELKAKSEAMNIP
jgi:hypothetical protein